MPRHGEQVASHLGLLRAKVTKLLTKEQSPGWLNNSNTKLSTLMGVDTMGLCFCWRCSTLLFAWVDKAKPEIIFQSSKIFVLDC